MGLGSAAGIATVDEDFLVWCEPPRTSEFRRPDAHSVFTSAAGKLSDRLLAISSDRQSHVPAYRSEERRPALYQPFLLFVCFAEPVPFVRNGERAVLLH